MPGDVKSRPKKFCSMLKYVSIDSIYQVPHCFRWLRRYIVPRHSRSIRSSNKRMVEWHALNISEIGPRVSSVLPTRDPAFGSNRTSTDSNQEIKQKIVGVWIVDVRNVNVRTFGIEKRRHPDGE